MSWDKMPGGDQVRYCGHCRLNVYNLAEMSREEVDAIVRTSKGRLCGRLYMRGDRTATLQDCPRGSARRKVRRAMAVVGVLLLGALGWLLRISGDRDRSMHPQWVRDVIEWVDPKPGGGTMMVGSICPPPRSQPPAPPSGTPQ
jgi:hypothetical protein